MTKSCYFFEKVNKIDYPETNQSISHSNRDKITNNIKNQKEDHQ